MTASQAIIGRAKALLVFGQGEASKGVVATITVRVHRRRRRCGLAFPGAGRFDAETEAHLRQNVLGCVNNLTGVLCPGRGPTAFDLSVTNLAAAASRDHGLRIAGFSADTAVFLALLSASLRIPLTQDIASTGHLASIDGQVCPVRSMSAKLLAATLDPTIRTTIVPAADADPSYQSLTPRRREVERAAVITARRNLRVLEVRNIDELLRAALDDDAVLWGSLEADFFAAADLSNRDNSPIDGACSFLGISNEGRFWAVLERYLFARRFDNARHLLEAHARWHLRKKCYPQGTGCKLRQLVRSLPPSLRRSDNAFPLLSMNLYLRLCHLVKGADHEDVQQLLDAAFGRLPDAHALSKSPENQPATLHTLEAVIAEMSAEALAHKLGVPIDSARASFAIDSVLTNSRDAFHDTIESFYAHLLRHLGASSASANDDFVRSGGYALLERSFANQGGPAAALAEARFGVQGGMRYVLDQMTDRFKLESQTQHLQRIVAEAVDPLNDHERTAFMAALLERLRPHLPDDLRQEPPERFETRYDLILKAYVRSLDRVGQILRTL